MTLSEVWAALRDTWWLPFAGMVAGGVAALAISLAQTPLYSASTQLIVTTPNPASPTDALQGGEYSLQRVSSYAELLRGQALAGRVVDRLGLSTSPAELSDRIVVDVPADSVLLDVTVADPSAQQAQRLAEAVGEEFTEMVTQVETPGAGGVSPVQVSVTEPPELPLTTSSPDTARTVGFGLLVGLLLGVSGAIARARLDRSVKDPDEVADLTGAPVLGVVLHDGDLAQGRRLDLTEDGPTAEGIRQLRTNLLTPAPARAVVVSGVLPGDGRMTLATNLALALAEAGTKVAVVEADLHQPRLARSLGMPSGPGLTDVLVGDAEIDEVTRSWRDGVVVVPGGRRPPNRGELLASGRLRSAVDRLRTGNDVVLVIGPPLLPVADSANLALLCDGVLLCVTHGRTRKDQLHLAATMLDRVGARTVGVVLNRVPVRSRLARTHGYGYGHHDEAGSDARDDSAVGDPVARTAPPLSHRR